MKVIRTADLTTLKTWLLGGQINALGNYCDGINTFCDNDCVDDLRNENGNLSEELIKEAVLSISEQFGEDARFNYYNDVYKFKVPCDKNLNILVKRIKSVLESNYDE